MGREQNNLLTKRGTFFVVCWYPADRERERKREGEEKKREEEEEEEEGERG